MRATNNVHQIFSSSFSSSSLEMVPLTSSSVSRSTGVYLGVVKGAVLTWPLINLQSYSSCLMCRLEGRLQTSQSGFLCHPMILSSVALGQLAQFALSKECTSVFTVLWAVGRKSWSLWQITAKCQTHTAPVKLSSLWGSGLDYMWIYQSQIMGVIITGGFLFFFLKRTSAFQYPVWSGLIK